MRKFRLIVFGLILAALPFQTAFFVDCTGKDTTDEDSSNDGFLYVLDKGNDSVYVLEDFQNITGAQDPVRTLSGEETLIQNPQDIAVDRIRNILYVLDASEDAVLVFSTANQVDGDKAPNRSLPVEGNPNRMSLDEENNRLYVSDIAGQQILVWDTVSQTTNNQIPNRTFKIDLTASDIFIDYERDLLYVGDESEGAVQVFSQASQSINDKLPVRSIIKFVDNGNQDDDEFFDAIDALAMNRANDTLFVVDSQNEVIDVFDNASELDGENEPIRSLRGDASGLDQELRFILFDENILYAVTADNEISVWNSANSLDGDTAPTRQITINGASQITSFDIDP